MFDTFDHYLSYGAADQQTARELTGDYDGLLVPGTVAAFQKDGTKGFVLTLSASPASPPRYVIDPRFPLFHQALSRPKKSHISLAEVLGDPGLVSGFEFDPEEFETGRLQNIATHWVQFNLGYTELNSKHFDKYAQRLGEAVVSEDATLPEAILPPYLMASSTDDPRWTISSELWRLTQEELAARSAQVPAFRVVAAETAPALEGLLASAPESRVVIWVDSLDELQVDLAGRARLVAYGRAIRAASQSGKKMFALYGGYFAVLLGSVGLNGCSHGIGFGENRAYVELPNSGPPPARYYLPAVHKYISQDLAQYLYLYAPALLDCTCRECADLGPGDLDYHSLMKHSVHARANEVRAASGKSAATLADELADSARFIARTLSSVGFPKNLDRQVQTLYSHLDPWAACLREIAD
ncbi:hypothetical protein Back2_10920 [Nocardioides baekrokdamisoli]|uniref:Uncharacterized protein n=1 Tax=Nocardioides baekrokdamisoli TaxID=1804624 RepID=A0A3G9ILB2_9ACTN|nr:hypothetical protein [Nocardioides baekrokdamisoli]BBH16805.1 hypothetical protein Back2_10920 [Nocardioides baekrokdamisoli]